MISYFLTIPNSHKLLQQLQSNKNIVFSSTSLTQNNSKLTTSKLTTTKQKCTCKKINKQ